jgi:hypothetical protein
MSRAEDGRRRGRVLVIGSDGRVIELCDQVRAERLAKHPNATAVRRRKDKKIVRIQLEQVSDESAIVVHRGNPRRYSHDHETEANPPRVWTMRRLGANDPDAEKYVREIYQASILDCLTTEAPPQPKPRPQRGKVVMFPRVAWTPQEKKAA